MIDFRAAARSVLVVGRMKDKPMVRIVAHDKSSLAPEGRSIVFELDLATGFVWRGYCDTLADELLAGCASPLSKTTQAKNLLRELLSNGAVPSSEIVESASALSISERTLKIAKQNLGVQSVRREDKWFSVLE